ncbi:MAG: conjugal transfer pilus assembly protein TraF [Pseudomonadota bacterium]|nr:conjugal transfer pilus assembly protein TraF [Pseudomonadota bacterium]
MIRFCVSYRAICVSYRSVLMLLLMMVSASLLAESPKGFLWYNLPKEKKQTPKPKGIPFSQLSYTERDAVLKFYTMEALHKVRFTHKIEDEKTFLALQNYWLKEAEIHGQINQKALLAYPEYDYTVTHPTSNIGIKIQDSIEEKNKKQALKQLAQQQGLLFFYRGKSKLDTRQIPILQAFCKAYGFQMIGVSVDGVLDKNLPESRLDAGESEAMHVHYFPAILLVNPKTRQVTPVAFGLTTQDVIQEHLWAIYQNFQGGFHA